MAQTIKSMDRWSVINELRKHVHPSHFRGIPKLSTEKLKILLAWYRS